jgi:threonyl-tRNA synthetase
MWECYTQGGFTDHAAGPIFPQHGVSKQSSLPIASAYWKGEKKNKQLTRLYGVTFPSQKELDEYLQLLEEAKKRSSKLGRN